MLFNSGYLMEILQIIILSDFFFKEATFPKQHDALRCGHRYFCSMPS